MEEDKEIKEFAEKVGSLAEDSILNYFKFLDNYYYLSYIVQYRSPKISADEKREIFNSFEEAFTFYSSIKDKEEYVNLLEQRVLYTCSDGCSIQRLDRKEKDI